MSFRKLGTGHGQQAGCVKGQKEPKGPHRAATPHSLGTDSARGGQAESMSVSIETIADQGRALGCTGTWGLETSLLPAPGPGMGVKDHAQTCVPRKSWQDVGLRAGTGGTAAERCGSCAAKIGRGNRDR